MERNRRSSFLFGRIFFDEPVSTSSENALAALPPAANSEPQNVNTRDEDRGR